MVSSGGGGGAGRPPTQPIPSGGVPFGQTSAPAGTPGAMNVLPSNANSPMTLDMMTSAWANPQWGQAPPPPGQPPVNPQIQIDAARAEIAKMISDAQAKQQQAAGREMQQQQLYQRAGGGGFAGFGGGRSSSNGYGGSARGGPGGFGGSSARGGRAY